MEGQSTNNPELIAQAKQAVLDGNAALARQLAGQVLDANPENIAAMLLMAGAFCAPRERALGRQSA